MAHKTIPTVSPLRNSGDEPRFGGPVLDPRLRLGAHRIASKYRYKDPAIVPFFARSALTDSMAILQCCAWACCKGTSRVLFYLLPYRDV